MVGLKKCCKECSGDSAVFMDITCEACNNEGFEAVPENQIVFVNVYSITRHYGGPEEGGWWYDWLECIEVFPVKNKAADVMADALLEEHAHIVHGDISSVLGGTALQVMIEEHPKQSQTREHQIYE